MANMNDLGVPDISALVRFGRIGVEMMASRLLSLTALFGIIALSAYSVYNASYVGTAIVAVLALFVFIPSLKAESGRAQEVNREQP
jgi:hypothetical protein